MSLLTVKQGQSCLDLQLHVQPVPIITTKVESSNQAYGEVYSIQHYVIKIYQWNVACQWFSQGTPVSSIKKNWLPRYNWNIVESDIKHHNPNIQPLSSNFVNFNNFEWVNVCCWMPSENFFNNIMTRTQSYFLMHIFNKLSI